MVIGGAQTVWDDIVALEELIGGPWPDLVIAVNDVGSHWPRHLDHWVSLHADKFRAWEQRRAANGYPNGYELWGHRSKNIVDRQVKPWGGGSSGLLAVSVADILRCDRVVLCGIPMNDMPHFQESKEHNPTKRWPSANSHWRAWERFIPKKRMPEWVRSMSGRTRKVLGAPTIDWLTGDPRS